MTKIPYLFQRGVAYEYRRAVPRPFWRLLGLRQVVHGLGAVSLAEARREALELTAHYDRQFTALRHLSAEDAARLVKAGGFQRFQAKVAHVRGYVETLREILASATAESDWRSASGVDLAVAAFEQTPTQRAVALVTHEARLPVEEATLLAASAPGSVSELADLWAIHTDSRFVAERRKRVDAALRALDTVTGGKTPTAITKADARRFRDVMRDRVGGAGHLKVIKGVWKIAAQEEAVGVNHFADMTIKTKESDKHAFEGRHLDILRAALPKLAAERRLAFRMLMTTGARAGELFRVKRDDIVLDGNVWTINFRATKTGRDYRIPLHSCVAAEVVALKESGTGEFLFSFGAKGSSTQKAFNRWLDEIGLNDPKLSLHSARHYVETALRDLKVNDHVAGALTGRKTIKGSRSSYTRLALPLPDMVEGLETLPAW